MSSPLINLFDRIYIINLAERTDRRRDTLQELARLGASWPSDKISLFPGIKSTEPAGFPTVGARGNYLSHLAVLREARSLGLRRVLVLEDDVAFTTRFLHEQAAIAHQLEADGWDLVYVGHHLNLPSNTVSFQPYEGTVLLTHCLALSGRVLDPVVQFLESLLDQQTGQFLGGPIYVDGAYSLFRAQHPAYGTWIATPSLAIQRSSPSDVAPTKWFDTMPGLRSSLALARRVRTWQRRRA